MRRPPPDRRPPQARWPRRRVLQLAAGAAGALPVIVFFATRGGPSDDPLLVTTPGTEGSPVPTGTPTVTQSPTPTVRPPTTPASPRPSPVATALTVQFEPPEVGTGEAMRVIAQAEGAASGTVQFNGATYLMAPLGDGQFWTVVAAPLGQGPGTRPLVITVRNTAGAVVGTNTTQTAVVTVDRPVQYLQATAEQVSVLTADAQAREDMLRAQHFSAFDRAPQWRGFFERPTPGKISTYFGQGRSINGGPVGGVHSGVDFADDHGTSVRLPAAGRIDWVSEMPIRGNSVIVDHGGGVKSGYHHLSTVSVVVGDAVLPAGTPLGAVGMTGFATGPHLHWEVTVTGTNVDPMTWLTTRFAP